MSHALLADVVVVLHVLFVLFVVLGGLMLGRWPRLAWLHLPAVAWGVLIEILGWTCPLTPLENHLRRLAGEAGYETGFITHYLTPLLYPPALDRPVQWLLGAAALLINLAIYAWWWRKRSDSRR